MPGREGASVEKVFTEPPGERNSITTWPALKGVKSLKSVK
jgi:hypothetical protein